MRKLTPWRQILAEALENREIIEVAAVVRAYLGRKPTRPDITAARRYAAAGNAKVISVADGQGKADEARLILGRPRYRLD